MPNQPKFRVGDTVKCVSRRKLKGDPENYLIRAGINLGRTLTINGVAETLLFSVPVVHFREVEFWHDPRNFKLIRRGK